MKRGILRLIAAAGVVSVLGCATPGGAYATAQNSDLFVIHERTIELLAPAPGERSAWTFRVENATTDAEPVYVAVTRVEGALFSGSEPGEVSVGVDGMEPVLVGPARALVGGEHVALATLPALGELRISGEIALPGGAGNDYQGASGSLTVQVAATRDSAGRGLGEGGGWTVAETGGTALWWWSIAAAGTALLGALLLARRRHTSAANLRESHDTTDA